MSADEPGREPGEPEPDAPAPTWRERLRPLELLGMSAAIALFGGGFSWFSIQPGGLQSGDPLQDWVLILVITGATFVVSLVVLAMLALGGYEPPAAPGPEGVLGASDRANAARDAPDAGATPDADEAPDADDPARP